MINILIFTKDQPLMADLLIRSIQTFYPNHEMIYIYVESTNERMTEAYHTLEDRLLMECCSFYWKYRDLKKELTDIFNMTQFEYTMMLSDRCVFNQRFDNSCVDILTHPDVISFNNFLGRHNVIRAAYKHNGYNLYDYKYNNESPFNSKGCICKTSELLDRFKECDFNDPVNMILQLNMSFIQKPLVAYKDLPPVVMVTQPVDNEEFFKNKQICLEPIMYLEQQNNIYDEPLSMEWRS